MNTINRTADDLFHSLQGRRQNVAQNSVLLYLESHPEEVAELRQIAIGKIHRLAFWELSEDLGAAETVIDQHMQAARMLKDLTEIDVQKELAA